MLLQRLTTLGVWTLVGWTATALLLRLLATPLAVPPGTQALAPEAPAPADLTRLFGAEQQAPVQAAAPLAAQWASRLQLLGVVAPREAALQSQQGLALIAVDGAPARAFRVGQPVLDGLQLLSVGARAVGLGPGQEVQLQLQLPDLPPASTGVLPVATLGPSLPAPGAPVSPQSVATPQPTPAPRSMQPMPPPTAPPLGEPVTQSLPATPTSMGVHSQPGNPQMPAYTATQAPDRDDEGGPRRPPPTRPPQGF